jgi:rhodanese-related sulfurtransferase
MMGGAMNLGIGTAFTFGSVTTAWALGAVLIALQLIVITTHFCVASWMYEGLLRLLGTFAPPIPVEEARELLRSGARLVDVREPAEFARGHLPGAVNLPVDEIERRADEIADRPAVLYCQSGLRSQRALQVLHKRHAEGEFHNLGAMSRWS